MPVRGPGLGVAAAAVAVPLLACCLGPVLVAVAAGVLAGGAGGWLADLGPGAGVAGALAVAVAVFGLLNRRRTRLLSCPGHDRA